MEGGRAGVPEGLVPDQNPACGFTGDRAAPKSFTVSPTLQPSSVHSEIEGSADSGETHPQHTEARMRTGPEDVQRGRTRAVRSQPHPLQHEGKTQTLSTLHERDSGFRKAAFGRNRASPSWPFPSPGTTEIPESFLPRSLRTCVCWILFARKWIGS